MTRLATVVRLHLDLSDPTNPVARVDASVSDGNAAPTRARFTLPWEPAYDAALAVAAPAMTAVLDTHADVTVPKLTATLLKIADLEAQTRLKDATISEQKAQFQADTGAHHAATADLVAAHAKEKAALEARVAALEATTKAAGKKE